MLRMKTPMLFYFIRKHLFKAFRLKGISQVVHGFIGHYGAIISLFIPKVLLFH
mgnify:CR=1 FL=1